MTTDEALPYSTEPMTLEEIRAQLGPTLLEELRRISLREAMARIEAKQRWIFAKTHLEPVISEASNDKTAKSFLPNHEFVIRSHSLAQLVVKCRKTAHSWGITAYSFCQATQVPRSQIFIGSYDEKEAKQKLNFLEWQYKAVCDKTPSLLREWRMSPGTEEKRFANGSTIHFDPRRAPTGAGGHFLGDEFSVEPPGKVSASDILVGAIGAITHRGNIRLGGTQRGKDTLFYQLYSGEWAAQAAENELLAELLGAISWEIGEFPWWESPALCVDVPTAIVQAPLMETLDRVMKYGNDKLKFQFALYVGTATLGLPLFQREFELKVVDDDEKFLDLDLIQMAYAKRDSLYWFRHVHIEGANFYQDQGVVKRALALIDEIKFAIQRGVLRGEWGWGMDIGMDTDLDEIVLGHNLPEDSYSLCLRAVISMHKLPFEGKMMVVQYLLKQLPVTRGAIDATKGSLGTSLAQFFEIRYGQRARGVPFTNTNKQLWASGWKARLQQRKMTLPWAPHPDTPAESDQFVKLRDQMLALKRIKTPSGFVRFDVERSTGSHGDCFWASALWNDLYPPLPDSSGQSIIIVPRGGSPVVGIGQRPRYGQSRLAHGGVLPQRRIIR